MAANLDNHISWVQIFGENEASVRHVTLDALCPSIYIGEESSAMEMRAQLLAADGQQYNVCEKNITKNDQNIVIHGQLLPSIPQEIKNYIVIGDTGYKSEDSCEMISPDQISSFNKNIIAKNPDILIHVGDLVYGNECYQGSKQAAHVSAIMEEFLSTSQDLLSKTPMVMGRGNHDACKKGNAWLGFFGHYKYNADECLAEDIYQIHMGQFHLAVYDVSMIPWGPHKYSQDQVDEGKIQYAEFTDSFISNYKNKAIFMTHQPIYSLRDTATLEHSPGRMTPYLEDVLGKTLVDSIYKVTALSGHYHICGSFNIGNFTQYISGCSGFQSIDEIAKEHVYNDSLNNAVGSLVVGTRGMLECDFDQDLEEYQCIFQYVEILSVPQFTEF